MSGDRFLEYKKQQTKDILSELCSIENKTNYFYIKGIEGKKNLFVIEYYGKKVSGITLNQLSNIFISEELQKVSHLEKIKFSYIDFDNYKDDINNNINNFIARSNISDVEFYDCKDIDEIFDSSKISMQKYTNIRSLAFFNSKCLFVNQNQEFKQIATCLNSVSYLDFLEISVGSIYRQDLDLLLEAIANKKITTFKLDAIPVSDRAFSKLMSSIKHNKIEHLSLNGMICDSNFQSFINFLKNNDSIKSLDLSKNLYLNSDHLYIICNIISETSLKKLTIDDVSILDSYMLDPLKNIEDLNLGDSRISCVGVAALKKIINQGSIKHISFNSLNWVGFDIISAKSELINILQDNKQVSIDIGGKHISDLSFHREFIRISERNKNIKLLEMRDLNVCYEMLPILSSCLVKDRIIFDSESQEVEYSKKLAEYNIYPLNNLEKDYLYNNGVLELQMKIDILKQYQDINIVSLRSFLEQKNSKAVTQAVETLKRMLYKNRVHADLFVENNYKISEMLSSHFYFMYTNSNNFDNRSKFLRCFLETVVGCRDAKPIILVLIKGMLYDSVEKMIDSSSIASSVYNSLQLGDIDSAYNLINDILSNKLLLEKDSQIKNLKDNSLYLLEKNAKLSKSNMYLKNQNNSLIKQICNYLENNNKYLENFRGKFMLEDKEVNNLLDQEKDTNLAQFNTMNNQINVENPTDNKTVSPIKKRKEILSDVESDYKRKRIE